MRDSTFSLLLLLLLIDLQLPGAYRFVAVPDGLHVHFGTPESTRPPTSPVPGPLHFSGAFLLDVFNLEGTTSSCGGAIAAIGGFGSALELLGLWIER